MVAYLLSLVEDSDKHKDTVAKINDEDLIESARSTFNNFENMRGNQLGSHNPILQYEQADDIGLKLNATSDQRVGIQHLQTGLDNTKADNQIGYAND